MTSDTVILTTIITIFIVLGIAMPFVNEAFNETSSTINTDGFGNELGQEDLSATDVFFNIFLMFFWTFGALPAWLDSMFLILRIVLAWLIVRVIRGVGG